MIEGLEAKGLTRSEIARAASISRTTVFRLAVGDARLPSFETISRLQALDARVSLVTDTKQR